MFYPYFSEIEIICMNKKKDRINVLSPSILSILIVFIIPVQVILN